MTRYAAERGHRGADRRRVDRPRRPGSPADLCRPGDHAGRAARADGAPAARRRRTVERRGPRGARVRPDRVWTDPVWTDRGRTDPGDPTRGPPDPPPGAG